MQPLPASCSDNRNLTLQRLLLHVFEDCSMVGHPAACASGHRTQLPIAGLTSVHCNDIMLTERHLLLYMNGGTSETGNAAGSSLGSGSTPPGTSEAPD
jgi:hypothetical protein